MGTHISVLRDTFKKRSVDPVVPEDAALDLLEDGVEGGRLLLERDRVELVRPSLGLNVRSEETEEEHILLPDLKGKASWTSAKARCGTGGCLRTSSAISMLAPSTVPSMSAPLSESFMFDVPLASVPAVEIWTDTSAAGMMTSASETE